MIPPTFDETLPIPFPFAFAVTTYSFSPKVTVALLFAFKFVNVQMADVPLVSVPPAAAHVPFHEAIEPALAVAINCTCAQ